MIAAVMFIVIFGGVSAALVAMQSPLLGGGIVAITALSAGALFIWSIGHKTLSGGDARNVN